MMIGTSAESPINIRTDDLVNMAIPAVIPKNKARSSLIVFTTNMEKNKIQINPALTAESANAIRS
ncbi:MAG: hypothetical protein ACD_12C00518G0001 [uncultured bacterium]|nr:MAG: hypothetical protein ACD_12C00518G0001 [uncultured bacterium]